MGAYQNPNATFIAAAQTNPSIFVKQSGSYGATPAGAGNLVVGVSQPNTKTTLVSYAADTNDPVAVFGESQECWLVYGGTVAAGANLKSDSSGRGVTASTGDNVGAVALEAGAVGELHRVRVQIFIAP